LLLLLIPILSVAEGESEDQKINPKKLHKFHHPKSSHPKTVVSTQFTTRCRQKHHTKTPISPKTPAKTHKNSSRDTAEKNPYSKALKKIRENLWSSA